MRLFRFQILFYHPNLIGITHFERMASEIPDELKEEQKLDANKSIQLSNNRKSRDVRSVSTIKRRTDSFNLEIDANTYLVTAIGRKCQIQDFNIEELCPDSLHLTRLIKWLAQVIKLDIIWNRLFRSFENLKKRRYLQRLV